jgi:hypothetical protein
LEHLAVKEKAILDQLEDFAFIGGGFLEHIQMRGGHGKGSRIQSRCTREVKKWWWHKRVA